MKVRKNKSTSRNKKSNKMLSQAKKKKRDKVKKNKKNKLKLAKAKADKSGTVRKSTFNYSLKKFQSLPLREKMLEKLKSSRFRFINEQLYKMKGKDALSFFQNDQEAFVAYHEGYNQQMKSWPKNPVNLIIDSLKKLLQQNKNLVIGDFGCGDAKIAKSLPDAKVHSFDLVSLDPCVTVCDMASTSLENESLDVAVFCLSLMGTNFSDYLVEANRVLKVGGKLMVAEVQSRFDNVEKFMEILTKFGFKIVSKNFSCKVFYLMNFEKERNLGKNSKKKMPQLSLKPCYYKKR